MIADPSENGYNVFENIPFEENARKPLKATDQNAKTDITDAISANEQKLKEDSDCDKLDDDDEDGDGDCGSDLFEFEESEAPLVPLYKLKEEGAVKWVLLSDLCNVLKVKSKDTLLKQVRGRRGVAVADVDFNILLFLSMQLSPSGGSPTTAMQKDLLRELRMPEFLERATCLQLLCAGEKLNIRSSKVTLVKYNESVRKMLGANTVVMSLKTHEERG